MTNNTIKTPKTFDNLILSLGIMVFCILSWLAPEHLIFTKPDLWKSMPAQNLVSRIWICYLNNIGEAMSLLRGEVHATSIAQDVVGFRALVKRTDPYPILGPAFQELGIQWDVKYESTHPPTAFLFVAPLAFLPWKLGSALWGYLMLACIFLSFLAFGVSWRLSLGLTPLTLLWPPIASAMGQLSIIWLLGLALAYHFRHQAPLVSGFAVGLATLTKLMPGIFMFPFLLQRKWQAFFGFATIVILSFVTIYILHPIAFERYFEVNQSNVFTQALRRDNYAPLLVVYRRFGVVGMMALAAFFASIIYWNRSLLLNEESIMSFKAWMLISYISIAFLPISWPYSYVPLLPIMTVGLWKTDRTTSLIRILCFMILLVTPVWGVRESYVGYLLSFILLGISFLTDINFHEKNVQVISIK